MSETMKFGEASMHEDKVEKIFSLSKDEFKIFQYLKTDNPKVIDIMREKGKSFDSGDIVIEIDGEKKIMSTKNYDFGTILTLETIGKKYGTKKRKMIETQ